MRTALLAMGMTVMAASPAMAQTGAPAAVATQPGAWGASGWQPGAANAAAPAPAAAPGFASAMPAPTYAAPAAPAYAAPVPARVYDRIEPGRKVKGPALANTVTEFAPWGLPQPGPGMRWIRYYDDAVLLDANNRAVDVRSVAWDAPRQAPPQQQAYGYPAYPAPQPYRAAGTYVEHHGNTTVTTQVLPPPAFVGGGYGPYGQVVSVVPGTVTTTTTTYWKPVRRGPIRHRRIAHRPCACGS